MGWGQVSQMENVNSECHLLSSSAPSLCFLSLNIKCRSLTAPHHLPEVHLCEMNHVSAVHRDLFPSEPPSVSLSPVSCPTQSQVWELRRRHMSYKEGAWTSTRQTGHSLPKATWN